MKRFLPPLLISTFAVPLLLACASPPAGAVGRLADLAIVDRDTGQVLPVYFSRGEHWVAGRPGARYAVQLRNRLGERLLAVPSVDGVNVLSGESAGWNQSGYVFSANERYEITGWRKSGSEVAAFEFSAAGDSYAGLTGRPANIGVIGVALFRERPAEPVAAAPLWREDSAAEVTAQPRLPAAPAASAKGAATAAPAQRAESRAMPAPQLGTAHGRRETSVVGQTSFERRSARPDEVISIRYDSRENLVALGVIREPAGNAPRPRPFPESGVSYAPDPPARRY